MILNLKKPVLDLLEKYILDFIEEEDDGVIDDILLVVVKVVFAATSQTPKEVLVSIVKKLIEIAVVQLHLGLEDQASLKDELIKTIREKIDSYQYE